MSQEGTTNGIGTKGGGAMETGPLMTPLEEVPRSFVGKVLVAVGVITGVLAVVLLLWFQVHVLLLGFAGVLVAVFLYTLAKWVSRRTGMRYWVSLTVVGLVVVAVSAGAVWLTEVRIASQVAELRTEIPQSLHRIEQYLTGREWGRWLLEHGRSEVGAASATKAGRGLSAMARYLVEAFVVLFVGIFGAINPETYVGGAMRLLPQGRPRDVARMCLTDLRWALWWWLVGQFVAMAFIGVVTTLVVWLLSVPLALTLGLLAALLNFIPNFGPLLAAVPAMLLALLVSPVTVLWVALAFSGIQLLQNHVVTPLTQQRIANLPAILLMLSQLFMYYWDGGLGMLLAPPLALAGLHLVKILYLHEAPRTD